MLSLGSRFVCVHWISMCLMDLNIQYPQSCVSNAIGKTIVIYVVRLS
jgi:hypothetical protein